MATRGERSDAQRRGAARRKRSASRPDAHPARPARRGKLAARKGGNTAAPPAGSVEEQLQAIEQSGGAGTLRVARGKTLDVTSLDKVYFPAVGATKGELMRYYARVAPVILPLIADRPLVLKRSPDGVDGETFFQQKPPARIPAPVRVESIAAQSAGGGRGKPERRIVGGEMVTLLYTVQLGCISVDPWFSRVGTIDYPDYAIIDLDPGPEAPFGRVVHAARLVHDEMERLGLRGALKTSGSRGLHIALPLPAGTPYDSALRLAELVATRVAEAHPDAATIKRSLAERPPAAVYLDYLQNARGKSLACAYCVRAKAGATVSTPIDWSELGDALDPGSFTIRSVPGRLEELGDIWGSAMRRANTRRAVASTLSGE